MISNTRGIANGKEIAAGSILSRLRSFLPVAPFFIFCFLFLVLPSLIILAGSFQDAAGHLTLENFRKLIRPNILESYKVTVELALVSAAGGTLVGFVIAYAVHAGGLPRWTKSFLLSFSGVASNFAGVPLAFAFIATLGRMGLVTTIFANAFGIHIYDQGFSLYGFWGLCLAYLYFQIPLMVLVISPAIESLRKEWREAARSLGASRIRYWMKIGIPVLAPALLSSALLLFGNAFGAYATAYALTGGMLNLVTILIGAQIRGDVLHDPNLGYALAAGMIAIMAVTTALAGLIKKRASRWLP